MSIPLPPPYPTEEDKEVNRNFGYKLGRILVSVIFLCIMFCLVVGSIKFATWIWYL